MGIVFLGVFLLVMFMAVVMGMPFVYYLKRDLQWDNAPEKSLDVWYN